MNHNKSRTSQAEVEIQEGSRQTENTHIAASRRDINEDPIPMLMRLELKINDDQNNMSDITSRWKLNTFLYSVSLLTCPVANI